MSNEYRGYGIGGSLFDKAKQYAQKAGAKQMYISATESENTVKFYLGRGCRVCKTDEVNKDLFELEPKDIPLICELG